VNSELKNVKGSSCGLPVAVAEFALCKQKEIDKPSFSGRQFWAPEF
jgi:hypothetical protein